MKDDSDSKTHMAEPEGEETFLGRWSRRKFGTLTAGNAAEVEPARMPPESTAAGQQELTDADMPAIDSLGEDSDYAAFMSPKVSETLRKQALHRLFHMPACNITDGLDDYDEDFTRFAGLGNVITHEMKRMLQRETESADADGAQAQDGVAVVESADAASAVDLSEPDHAGDDAREEGDEQDDILQGPTDA